MLQIIHFLREMTWKLGCYNNDNDNNDNANDNDNDNNNQ